MTDMQLAGVGIVVMFGLIGVVFGNDWDEGTKWMCIAVITIGAGAMLFGG